jgi:Secretion system C-terminal sorting domain
MKIYPNPASSQVTLALPESKEAYQIRLVNTQGHLMYQIDNQAVNPTIDVSGLADGMYFVQILDKRGTVLSVGRIVKIE